MVMVPEWGPSSFFTQLQDVSRCFQYFLPQVLKLVWTAFAGFTYEYSRGRLQRYNAHVSLVIPYHFDPFWTLEGCLKGIQMWFLVGICLVTFLT